MIEYPPAGVESPGVQRAPARPGKSFVVTWLLAMLVGVLGVDRFYLGKVGTGLLKLVTCGGAGVWALVDLVLVLTGSQRDKLGRPLAGYREGKSMAWAGTAVFVVLGLVVGACGAAATDEGPPASAVVGESDTAGDDATAEVADGPWELHVTHDGERNFAVVEETDEMFSTGLLVNEIGRYEGTVPLSGGPSVVTVTADGAWTLRTE